ncbi:MAG: SPOR domain-containing protein [Treponema sp.]|nr:SPOR domain-containing protein [Treponema sp.]
MEQKRTLWILLASGIFLLVVIGVALIFYAPEEKKAKTASHPEGNTSILVEPEPGLSEPYRSLFDNTEADTSEADNEWFTDDEPVVSYIEKFENTEEETHEEETAPVSEEPKENLPVYTSEETDGITTIEITSSPVTPKSEAARKAISIVTERKKAEEEKSVRNFIKESASNSSGENKNEKTYASEEKTESRKSSAAKTSSAVEKETEKKTSRAETASVTKYEPVSASGTSGSAKTSSSKASSKTAEREKEKEPDRFWIQTGSFESRKKADEARSILTEAGYQCEVFTFRNDKGILFFRVRVGPYTTKAEADFWKKDISSKLESFKSTQSYITNSTVRK